MIPRIIPKSGGIEPGTGWIQKGGDPGYIIVGIFLIGCVLIWYLNG